MSAQPDKYPEELLADLVSVVEQSLVEGGVDGGMARSASFKAVENLRQRWGGLQIYFPKGKDFMLSKRDLQVWNEFNGHNHKELAVKYDMSEQQVYRIVKQMKLAQVRLRQRDAFDDAAGAGL